MVIDGKNVITGSFNFTKAAEENNAENLLIRALVSGLHGLLPKSPFTLRQAQVASTRNRGEW